MTWLRAHRWTVATVAVVVALVLPIARDRDSYPLSTYPMYAEARAAAVDLPTAVGVDAEGRVHRLSLDLIGASDDPLIVAGGLRDAIDRGRADERCADIAQRVAGERRALVGVEVVVERRDVVAHVRDEDALLDRTVAARCPVPERP
jgi:hypothetical protein